MLLLIIVSAVIGGGNEILKNFFHPYYQCFQHAICWRAESIGNRAIG